MILDHLDAAKAALTRARKAFTANRRTMSESSLHQIHDEAITIENRAEALRQTIERELTRRRQETHGDRTQRDS